MNINYSSEAYTNEMCPLKHRTCSYLLCHQALHIQNAIHCHPILDYSAPLFFPPFILGARVHKGEVLTMMKLRETAESSSQTETSNWILSL